MNTLLSSAAWVVSTPIVLLVGTLLLALLEKQLPAVTSATAETPPRSQPAPLRQVPVEAGGCSDPAGAATFIRADLGEPRDRHI